MMEVVIEDEAWRETFYRAQNSWRRNAPRLLLHFEPGLVGEVRSLSC